MSVIEVAGRQAAGSRTRHHHCGAVTKGGDLIRLILGEIHVGGERDGIGVGACGCQDVGRGQAT